MMELGDIFHDFEEEASDFHQLFWPVQKLISIMHCIPFFTT